MSILNAVAGLIEAISIEHVMPYYRQLTAADIREKAPGDLVTSVDHAVESALADGLLKLLPEAGFVGEERCARMPALLDTIGGGLVWVVDPIDGTGNFAAGKAPFAIMVALMRDGRTIASWIYDPLSERMMTAEGGAGAWRNGCHIRTDPAPADIAAVSGIVSRFAMPDVMADAVTRLERAAAAILPTARCAGHEYPKVAMGECDFALYWRTLVWDHAAGALLLTEAGGVVERLDGSAYRPGSSEVGLLLARNRFVADAVRAALIPPP